MPARPRVGRRAARQSAPKRSKEAPPRLLAGKSQAVIELPGGARVHTTNLMKLFWPDLGITKGDLIQYYMDVAPVLLPHVRSRAMVMKRYPNGAFGEFFFMKRAPSPRPEWIRTCSIEHSSGSTIDFPVVNDLATLIWVVNLGCIDLNPWYARCDDVDRPDYLHFDLDPGEGVEFAQVREAALIVHDALSRAGMPSYVKTTGSKGLHIYVPIARGPTQKQVWTLAKGLAVHLATRHPRLLTAAYRIATRPRGRVLVDYNQNAWGRTLASVYSVRPQSRASVSTPLDWKEVSRGVEIEDFRIDNIRDRIARRGDLWAPMAPEAPGRFDFGSA